MSLIIASDLDGTLWETAGRLPRESRSALDELAHRGLPVLAVTSRREPVLKELFDTCDLELPAVMLDGAVGKLPGFGDVFHTHPYSHHFLDQLLNLCRAYDVVPVLFGNDPGKDAHFPQGCTTTDQHRQHLERHLAEDFPEVVLGVSFVSRIESVVDQIVTGAREEGLASPVKSHSVTMGGWVVTMAPHGVSKWAATMKYVNHVGLSRPVIVGVGDGFNDVPLLEKAHVSVGVEGAPKEVLQHCDHIIGRPEEGGWARVPEIAFEALAHGVGR